MQSALADAGFDILTNPPPLANHSSCAGSASGGLHELLAGKRQKHIQQCSLCQEEEVRSDFDSKSSFERNIVGQEAFRPDVDIPRLLVTEETVLDTNKKFPEASRIDTQDAGPFRVTLSIGGMTCSSCTGAITSTVSGLRGVSEVAVSLLGKSATVIVDRKQVAEDVVNTVEDCGFEADVINITQLNAVDEDSTSGPRVVALRIDGMFCR
jgi:copper chaperone CopZ